MLTRWWHSWGTSHFYYFNGASDPGSGTSKKPFRCSDPAFFGYKYSTIHVLLVTFRLTNDYSMWERGNGGGSALPFVADISINYPVQTISYHPGFWQVQNRFDVVQCSDGKICTCCLNFMSWTGCIDSVLSWCTHYVELKRQYWTIHRTRIRYRGNSVPKIY